MLIRRLIRRIYYKLIIESRKAEQVRYKMQYDSLYF